MEIFVGLIEVISYCSCEVYTTQKKFYKKSTLMEDLREIHKIVQ